MKQMNRRHGKTMKVNGKKLDKPTHEAVVDLYYDGMKAREEFPNSMFYGVSSTKKRTYITAATFLMGAGAIPFNVLVTDSLDLKGVSAGAIECIRNQKNDYGSYSVLFEQAIAKNELSNNISAQEYARFFEVQFTGLRGYFNRPGVESLAQPMIDQMFKIIKSL